MCSRNYTSIWNNGSEFGNDMIFIYDFILHDTSLSIDFTCISEVSASAHLSGGSLVQGSLVRGLGVHESGSSLVRRLSCPEFTSPGFNCLYLLSITDEFKEVMERLAVMQVQEIKSRRHMKLR